MSSLFAGIIYTFFIALYFIPRGELKYSNHYIFIYFPNTSSLTILFMLECLNMANQNLDFDNKNLLSPCGLYCGVCGIYVATRDSNESLQKKLAATYGTRPSKTACRGCMQPEPAECLFQLCNSCLIRACARDKDLNSCAQCDAFPCNKIDTFPFPVARQFMLEFIPQWRAFIDELGEEEGGKAFAKSQMERFSCKNCGQPLFRGATFCKSCNSPVE